MCKSSKCDEKTYKKDLCLAHYGASLIIDIVEFELNQRNLISNPTTEEDLKIIEDISKDYLKRHNYFWNDYINEQVRQKYFNKSYFIDC